MNQTASTKTVHVRPAKPADVPALLEMKRALQITYAAEFAFRATVQDWLRDAFGPRPQFTAFVAETASFLVGMITCSERYYTGWAGSTMFIQDIFVEPDFRQRGIGKMLLARAAVHALERECLIIELTVQKDSPVRRLYRRSGFSRVDDCATYVAGAEAITILAGTLPKSWADSRPGTSNE